MEDIIKYKGKEIKRRTITEYFEILKESRESNYGSFEISANDLIETLEEAKLEFGKDIELHIEFNGTEESDYSSSESNFSISVIESRLQTDEEFEEYIKGRKLEIDLEIIREQNRIKSEKADKERRIRAAQDLLRKEGLL